MYIYIHWHIECWLVTSRDTLNMRT